jgi:tricorn protease
LFLVLLALAAFAGFAAAGGYILHYPDVSGNTVVFVSGNDIWSAPVSGGVAARLTLNDGLELYPKFSPDGKMIAFTGDYDGNQDVYVMDADGGHIKRLTFHPGNEIVAGWNSVKNKIIFSSTMHSFNRFEHLFMISPDGTGLEELPLCEASHGSFSPDGGKIAYNTDSREARTWKRYKGGRAQQIHIYNFATKQDKQITEYDGTNRLPMWIGDIIYFMSDRDRTLNIWGYNVKTGEEKQYTFHKDYDVLRAGTNKGRIAYEKGGDIWLFDPAANTDKKLDIEVKSDAPETRAFMRKVDGFIQGFDVSPSGKRAVITARGEIFTVPLKNGPTRNLTNDCGARDKDAVWSPDGKTIAYFSDKTGEYEIWITDASGKGEPQRLTTHKDGYRHTLRFSPDGKKLAYTDQTLTLYYIDIAKKKITKVDKADYQNMDISLDVKDIYDYSWSPDSRYIAYSKMDADYVTKIYIYSLEDGKIRCASIGIFNDFNPVFSKDGLRLFFVSNRRFNPVFCDFDWEMVYKNMAGIYAMTLSKDTERMFPFKSDEETPKADKKKDEKPAEVKVRIDFDGLAERVEALPIEAGNYRNLIAGDEDLFYTNGKNGDYNRFEYRTLGPQTLYAFSFAGREEAKVIDEIDGYALSADRSSIIYKKDDQVGIIKTSDRDSKGKPLNLGDLKMWLDPVKEWAQIFNEAWRIERDFYYEPNMHGLDWNAMKVKYGRLEERVTCRQDLRFVIGELIGELNTSHTYVYPGDARRRPEPSNVGMLGVDWNADSASNRYRFGKIYRIADWTDGVIPPLAAPGINIKEGDYLLKVNNTNVTADNDIYSYFQNLAGKQITITANSQPTSAGAKEYTVQPLRGEGQLRYEDWIEGNRLKVEKASGGAIGYIHLPDTFTGSAKEFPKYFYSQTRKQGLIIDGRFNGGGLDPDIFLSRIRKEIISYWTRRNSHDQYTPHYATRAHLACLTNRQAGSGGDELPYEFQVKKMGPVIGTRTWGGLVGVSMFVNLIDGGALTSPDYRIYDPQGKWIVENTGVTPDIIVDLTPEEMQRGYDAQLMTAVDYLMKKIKEEPRPWPKHEAYPVDK